MKRVTKGKMFAAVALALATRAAVADGTTYNFKSNAPTNNWASSSDWISTAVPGTGDIIQFDQGSYTNGPVNSALSVLGLYIGDASGNLNNNGGTPTPGTTPVKTFGGTACPLTLGASGITSYANAGATNLAMPITASTAQQWSSAGAALTLISTATVTYSGQVTMTGGSAISISSASVGSGGVVINGANVVVGNATAFGTGIVTLSSGTLTQTTSTTVEANSLVINGNFNFNSSDTTHSVALSGGGVVSNSPTLTVYNTSGVQFASSALQLNSDVTFAGATPILLSGGITGNSAGNKTINLSHTGTATFSTNTVADGSGTLALNINGGGTVAVNVTTGYSGGTTIANGLVKAGVTNALPTAGTVTFGDSSGGAGILDLNAFSLQVGGLALASSATAASQTIKNSSTTTNVSLTVDTTPGNSSFGGVISGGRMTVVKQGANTLALTGINTYTASTTISAGALQAVDGVGLPAAGALILDGGVLQSNGVASFTRTISAAAGNFDWTANGGGFSANGGKLTVTIANNPATELTWGTTVGVNLVGTLKFGSTTANAQTELTNRIDLVTTDRTIDVAAGAGGDFATLSGVIRNSSGTAGITKTGAGVLVLSATNTYNGQTAVSNGALLINGQTSTGALTVASGAVLAGNGTIGGTISNSGTVAPGPALSTTGAPSIGILADSNNFTLAIAAATLDVEVGADGSFTAGTDFDQLAMAASKTVTIAGATVEILPLGDVILNHPYRIVSGTGYSSANSNVFGTLLGINGAGTMGGPSSTSYIDGGVAYDLTYINGAGIDVTFTSVPEPTSFVMLSLTSLGLLRRTRRRTISCSQMNTSK